MENFSEEYILSTLESLSAAQEASISELNRLFPACLAHACHNRFIPLNRFTAVAEKAFRNARKAIIFLTTNTAYFRNDGSIRLRRGQENDFRAQTKQWLESAESFSSLCARQAQTAREEAKRAALDKAAADAQADLATVCNAAADAVEALAKRFPQHTCFLRDLSVAMVALGKRFPQHEQVIQALTAQCQG